MSLAELLGPAQGSLVTKAPFPPAKGNMAYFPTPSLRLSLPLRLMGSKWQGFLFCGTLPPVGPPSLPTHYRQYTVRLFSALCWQRATCLSSMALHEVMNEWRQIAWASARWSRQLFESIQRLLDESLTIRHRILSSMELSHSFCGEKRPEEALRSLYTINTF